MLSKAATLVSVDDSGGRQPLVFSLFLRNCTHSSHCRYLAGGVLVEDSLHRIVCCRWAQLQLVQQGCRLSLSIADTPQRTDRDRNTELQVTDW